MELTYKKFKKRKASVYKPAATLENARSYALYLLAKQMYTSAIIKDKLEQKDYSPKDTDTVITEMIKLGYINDANYADVYFRNLSGRAAYGFFGIKQRLQRKKLPEEEIIRVMSTLTPKKELEMGLKFVSSLSSLSTQQKLVRMLQNRGFRWDAISGVLKKLKGKLKGSREDFSIYITEE